MVLGQGSIGCYRLIHDGIGDSIGRYWLIHDGTGSVEGGTGWYLVVLVDIWWYWVSTGRCLSVLGGIGSVEGGTGWHNGPEGWVQLTKVTSLCHITSSNKNLDQISSSESPSSINFIITKYQQCWFSISTEVKLEILTKPSFRISTKIQLLTSTKHQQQNTNQTPASNYCLNLNFKILTKPCAQSLNKS